MSFSHERNLSLGEHFNWYYAATEILVCHHTVLLIIYTFNNGSSEENSVLYEASENRNIDYRALFQYVDGVTSFILLNICMHLNSYVDVLWPWKAFFTLNYFFRFAISI